MPYKIIKTMAETPKIDSQSIDVKMVDTGRVTRNYKYQINGIAKLGREIKISPKSCVTVNKPGYSVEFYTESVNVVIGIGKDNTADLIMSKEAWDALLNGEEISITTTDDFVKKYVNKSKKK